MNSSSSPLTAAPAGGILRPALTLFALLSLACGLLYPLAVTGLAQAVFPHEAQGSLIVREGQVIGSTLIGQSFTDPQHFWGRPSATAPMAYNAAASGGSNLGPSHPAQADAVQARIAALRAADPGNTAAIPVDLVTASGSGLDPDISRAGADYQVARVARVRSLPQAQVQALVERHTETPWMGFLGEPRVRVLPLNLALDQVAPPAARP